MISRRIICQTSRVFHGSLAAPNISTLNSHRGYSKFSSLLEGHQVCSIAISALLCSSCKMLTASNDIGYYFLSSHLQAAQSRKASAEPVDSESISQPAVKSEVNPKINIADRIKASFQKGGLLQKQNSQNSLRNRQNSFNSTNGGHNSGNNSNSNTMKSRAIGGSNFNTGGGGGGGGRQQQPKKASTGGRDAAPQKTAPPKRTVQRGRVQESAKVSMLAPDAIAALMAWLLRCDTLLCL